MNKLFIVSLVFSAALACNNYCNGHGKCTTGDKCECFIGWGGADCSLRSCPYSDAFVDIPLGDLNHDKKVDDTAAKDEWRPNGGISENLKDYVTATRAHRYAECSNAGVCDRNSGECVCFDGYEGSACQRRSCPNVDGKVCSGHGSCLTSTTIIHDNGGTYYGWESEKYMSCLCDNGWEGIDCSMRVCPKGNDPVTSTSYEYSYTISSSQIYDGKENYLSIVYDGIKYDTPSFSKVDMKDTCGGTNNKDYDGVIKDASKRSFYSEEIRKALSSIPAFSKASVEFVCPGTTGTGGSVEAKTADIKITLGHADINAFTSIEISKCENGQTCTKLEVDQTKNPELLLNPDKVDNTNANNKQYLCSRRGLCKSDTGECECFYGYTGEACQNQRTIAL